MWEVGMAVVVRGESGNGRKTQTERMSAREPSHMGNTVWQSIVSARMRREREREEEGEGDREIGRGS
jgi:guanylate kinase